MKRAPTPYNTLTPPSPPFERLRERSGMGI